MGKNSLTPQQDIITRQFYVLVTQQANHDPSELRQAGRICINLLNYQVTGDGRFLAKDPEATRTIKFGEALSEIPGECEWDSDYKRALKAGGKDAQANNKDSVAPDRSEQTKDSPLRKALLREDV